MAFLELTFEEVSPLCEYTRAVVEDEAWRIAEELAVEDPDLIPVRISSAALVADRCTPAGDQRPGCVLDGPVVEATLGAVPHEIVHALRAQHLGPKTTPFFEEGLAAAVGSGPLGRFAVSIDAAPRDPAQILDLVHAPRTDLTYWSYVLAGHYVAWLRDTYGAAPVLEFFAAASNAPASERFAAAVGDSIESVTDRWATDAPASIVLDARCDHAIPLQWDGDAATLELDLACDAEGNGPWESDGHESVSRSFCLAFETSGTFEVELQADSDSTTLTMSSVECYGPASLEAHAGKSVRPSAAAQAIEFAPCLWQGAISDELDNAGHVRLSFRR